jgi:hypothetical protein
MMKPQKEHGQVDPAASTSALDHTVKQQPSKLQVGKQPAEVAVCLGL